VVVVIHQTVAGRGTEARHHFGKDASPRLPSGTRTIFGLLTAATPVSLVSPNVADTNTFTANAGASAALAGFYGDAFQECAAHWLFLDDLGLAFPSLWAMHAKSITLKRRRCSGLGGSVGRRLVRCDILCQGRGSSANSAACYCLGITEVDPSCMEMPPHEVRGAHRGVDRGQSKNLDDE